MSHFALALIVGGLAVATAGVIAAGLGIGSWGLSAIAITIGLLATLIDRDGFYGPTATDNRPA